MYLAAANHAPRASPELGELPSPGEIIGPVVSFVFGGDFITTFSSASFIHAGTPPTQTFRLCERLLKIHGRAPKLGPDRDFLFRLRFEHNGNDIRNLQIIPLARASKPPFTFKGQMTVHFSAQRLSVPLDPLAEVIVQISGRWQATTVPVVGSVPEVSFWGGLRVRSDGRTLLSLFSEKFEDSDRSPAVSAQFLPNSAACVTMPPAPPPRTQPIVRPIPFTIFFSPAGSDRVREGDEERLARFYFALSEPVRRSFESGVSPIHVQGFASTTQSGSANRDLARRRANKVVDILRDLAGSDARIVKWARGEYQARVTGETQEERRVEITFLHTISPGEPDPGPVAPPAGAPAIPRTVPTVPRMRSQAASAATARMGTPNGG